jgi:hypothetical protein
LQAARLYRIERGRDVRVDIDRQARAAAEQRAQATRVSAWVDTKTGQNAAGEPAALAVVVVRNQSELPIYDVVLRVVQEDSSLGPWKLALLPPRVEHSDTPVTDSPRFPDRDFLLWLMSLRAEISFMDSGGRRWHRNAGGELSEDDPNAPAIPWTSSIES